MGTPYDILSGEWVEVIKTLKVYLVGLWELCSKFLPLFYHKFPQKSYQNAFIIPIVHSKFLKLFPILSVLILKCMTVITFKYYKLNL